MTDEETLLEWIIFYAKNKDMLKKEIKDYKILKNYVDFEMKDKKHVYYSYPILNNEIIEKSKEGLITVVCLNNKENLDFVVKSWDNLIHNPKFSMIFVNPKLNQRWIIVPHIHNKITDKSALKPGLLSLYSEVPSV